MSLTDRMRANLGDADPAWQYLLAKVGHTALIAWCLVAALHLPMVYAGTIAAVGYLVVGKVLWFHSTTDVIDVGAEIRDCIFDGLLGLSVAIVALVPLYGWRVFCGVTAMWAALMLVLGNNRWGRPG